MSDQSQQFPFSDLGDHESSTDSTLGGGRTSRRRPTTTGSSQVEAELAAIFGEDELIRHPPDPFEEKILTGRNSFGDLRDQLAQEDRGDSAPAPTPRPSRLRDTDAAPRPRPATRESGTAPRQKTSDPQSRIAELRRNLADGTSRPATTPAPSDSSRSRFFHDEPGATPAPAPRSRTTATNSDSEDRITALRRDLANRRAAAAEAADAASRPRPASTEEPRSPRPPRTTESSRPRPSTTGETARPRQRTDESVQSSRPRPQAGEESVQSSRPRPVRTDETLRPRPAEGSERPRPSRTEESQRRAPRTEESVRPRPEPVEETQRTRPTRTPAEPRPRQVRPVDEDIAVEAPVRERRPARAPAPIVEEPIDEYPLDEYPLFEEPPMEEEPPRKTRTPRPEPAPEPDFIAPEPEPVAEPPAKRRPKAPPAAPSPVPVRRPAEPLAPSSGDVAVVSQVTKTYGEGGKVQALRGVSLAVPQGRLTAIMGRSGSGKSTLLYLMAGLEVPTSGTVTVAGQALSDMKERQRDKFRRDSIGLVLREFNLLPTLSVADNVRLASSIKKESVDQGWYDQVIAVTRLADVLTRKPDDLTADEQQRVGLARALVTKPAMILADEPTGNLGSEAAGDVLAILRDAVTVLGQTVVVATHDAAVAAIADQVWVLDNGTVVEQIKSPTLPHVIDALRLVSGGPAA